MPLPPCTIAIQLIARSSSNVGKRFQLQPSKCWMIGQMLFTGLPARATAARDDFMSRTTSDTSCPLGFSQYAGYISGRNTSVECTNRS